MMKRLFASLALVLLLPCSAHAWWAKEWTLRKPITLDTQAAGIAAEVADLPVLVRLSTGNFDFLSAKEDGSDIRFVSEDDATVLKYHVERFDKINELAFIWVLVPKVAPNNTGQHIWLYSGNPEAPSLADSKTSFDAAQLAVLHLSETTGLPQDATVNASHVTQGNLTYVPAGLMGGGARLAGDGGLLLASPKLAAAKEFTFSAWIKPQQADGELLALGPLTLELKGGVPVLTLAGAATPAAAPITLNAWHHLAVTAAATGCVLYVDGVAAANVALVPTPAGELKIGAGLVGEIDEVQLAGMARSPAWLSAQVQSQGQAGKLVKYGEDKTTKSDDSTSYFATTLSNLTVDGWVVVGICVLMFFVAIFVMLNKAVLLARASAANDRFAEAFAQMSRNLSAVDDSAHAHAGHLDQIASMQDTFKHSPLYRIYHVGVSELKNRFPNAGHGAAAMPALSSRAFNAVRASLDTQLIRESNRLNSGMVLLTIAISGGPFLGLLGTVVGVMITFAAIAAQGDVNVNAIAPGIAAALVATVAGLGVAIPSLFGYNYLTTRIKTVSSDMHVFVDEFITKMDEQYGA